MSYPTYEKTFKTEIKLGEKIIKIEIGRFSQQASAAVIAQMGETVVHTTVALGDKVDWGYFPLHVEYIEKLYAGGIIKGSRWVKREGRPSDDAVLKARVIDRSIRPLFPEGITNQVQVVSTVFSHDGENQDDMLALLSTGIALAISDLPFQGSMAGLRLGYSQQQEAFVVNPTNSELEELDMDLIVSGTEKSLVMVEAGADEVDEEVVIEGLMTAQKTFAEICPQIDKIKQKIGRDKIQLVPELEPEAKQRLETMTTEIEDKYLQQIKDMIKKQSQLEEVNLDELAEEIVKYLNDEIFTDGDAIEVEAGEVKDILHKLMKKEARRMILEDKIRPDGRKPDEIRPIWCEIDVFPRTHGSAMFKRGATQAITIATLGSPSLGQHIEDMEGEEVRHYLHHYNMPPYSWGGAGRFGYPKRREVGHGRLAERALLPMVPSQEEFPYTIRVVSEIMSSNGSTSQASVCGSTMSLMAAGVPLKKPVAGIAMGLVSDGLDNYVVLSDIQGLEDHSGDMDFKVAGTRDGITAIQMDIKLTGITVEILRQALGTAKKGRLHILGEMLKAIDQPRSELSEFAPKIEQIIIPSDRIGELIGPGGKVIKGIIEETGAEIDIEENEELDQGVVNISSSDQAQIDAAKQIIENMMRVVEVGDEFSGEVTRIEDYGAFVEYLPGREGLVHISKMAEGYVKDPRSLVKLEDQVEVRVSEIKDDGKIGLSMLTAEQEQKQAARKRSSRRDSRNSRGSRDSRGSNRSRDSRSNNCSNRSSSSNRRRS